MRYFARTDIVAVKQLALGLVTFSPAAPGGVGALFYVHLMLVSALRGLLAVQQAGAHGRRVPQPHAQPGQQQPREAAREPLELPRQGPHLRGVGRRVPGQDEGGRPAASRGRRPMADGPQARRARCRSTTGPRPRTGWTLRSNSARAPSATARPPRTSSTWACPTRASGSRSTRTGSCRPTGSRSSSTACASGSSKYRSFRLFMDICVRCGACADKCHFFIGVGRSQEHAGAARRAAALGLPPLLHRRRAHAGPAGRRPRPDRGRDQGVVLLLLPVHRVPPLLGLLPLRHRHRRDHHDRPRAAEPDRLQHQLGARAGGQLLPHRQPPGHPAARLQGQPGFRRRRAGGAHRHPRRRCRSTKGRRDPLRHAFGRLLRHPALLHLPRLPGAVPRDRPGLHLQRLSPPRAATSACSPPTR